MNMKFKGKKGYPHSTAYINFCGEQYDAQYLPKNVRDKIEFCVNNFEKVSKALKACYAHAEDMTCELDKTDDMSEYPYLVRSKEIIAKINSAKIY